MARPLFSLGPRLALCGELVREGAKIADVGTDHAYLPIWLLRSGKCPAAVAADINEGPLESARANGGKYGVGERLRVVLSDGLENICPQEADDIVLAGMGGTLILQLIGKAAWLRDKEKRLVLQPMTCAAELRAGLWEKGFAILEERACLDSGKVYSAFSAAFKGELGGMPLLYPVMGRLEPGTEAVTLYARKQARDLENQRKGAAHRGETEKEQHLAAMLEALGKVYGKE